MKKDDKVLVEFRVELGSGACLRGGECLGKECRNHADFFLTRPETGRGSELFGWIDKHYLVDGVFKLAPAAAK